jgi:hypothetical protein
MKALRPETAMRALLLEDSEIAAATQGKILRGAAPQKGERPYGVFSRIRTESHQNMNGPSGLFEVDVMFAWCGIEFDDLGDLAFMAEDVLDGARGVITVGARGIEMDSCYLLDDRDGDIQIPDGSEKPIYCIEQIYRAAFRRL